MSPRQLGKAGRPWQRLLAETTDHLAAHAWGEALLAAERGLRLRSLPKTAGGLFHYHAAMALTHIGDLRRAEEELLFFQLAVIEAPELCCLTGDALFALARLMELLRQPERQVRYLEDAAAIYTEQGRFSQVLACQIAVGWSLLLAGRTAEALPELQAASQAMLDHGYPEAEVDLAAAMALYQSMSGATREADELCADLVSRPDLLARQRADCFWVLAWDALARGDLPRAADYALDARAAAVQDWWPPQLERIELLEHEMTHRVQLRPA